MSITQYTVRVANYIDGAGNELEFTTSTGARRNLATAPTIAGATLGILDPIASSGGMMWELIGTPAALQPLTRRDLEYPQLISLIPPQPVRLRDFCTNTDVSIKLNQPGLVTPQFVFIGGETMRLDSEINVAVYAVTRAIGSLGVARTHQWVYETQPPPLVLARPSNPTGMRVSVEDQNGLVYRGVLRSASRTDHGCALDIVSMVGWLRERRQSPVDPKPAYSSSFDYVFINTDERKITYRTGYSDSWAPQRARIYFGDAWLVCPVTNVALFGNDQYVWDVGEDQPIVQWGKGDTAYPLNNCPQGLIDAALDPLTVVTRVESLWTYPQDTPSNVLQAMLTDDWPPGQVAGMDPSDVGNLSALDDAYGVGNMTPPYCDDPGALWWPGGNKGSVMLADAIAQNFMAPMLCGMTADAFGRIMVIDWLRCLGGTETIIETDLMRGLGAVGDTMPVRIVRWTQTELGGEQVLNFQSDLVSQVVGGGREIAVKPGWLQNAAGWMYDRLSAALQIYQLSVPMLTITMTAGKAVSINLEPGLVVGLTCSTLWNRQGLRGVSDIDGIVVGITKRLASEGGTVDAVLALTGYSVQANVGKWAPSGRVVSAVGSTITMTMDNGEDVDQWFTAGVAVALTDPTGLVLDASITVTSSNATSITVSGLGVTPALGDRIELATYSVAQYPDAAYYGEGFDYV